MSADRCPRPGPIGLGLLVATASLVCAVPAFGQEAEALFGDLEVCGCLAAEPEVVERLEVLRVEHVAELERRGYRRAWRRLRRRLKQSSPDGRALVEAWLDSPERARRIYLCQDELPIPEELDVADFADLALDDLAGRWWEDEGRLNGADRDREGAASDLDETDTP